MSENHSSFFLLILPSQAIADDFWWQKLKAAASSCFDGRDIKLEFSTGVGAKTLGDRAKTGPFSELRFTFPFYSHKETQNERRKEANFLEKGAEIIQQLNESKVLIEVKTQKAEVLKQAMIQEGMSGIEAYFKILEEISVLKTNVEAAELKLTGFIEACEK